MPTQKELQFARLESARADVALLLAFVPRREVGDDLACVIRDIDLAFAHLNQDDIERRPTGLAVVDLLLHLAESRISIVRDAVSQSGP